jgi:hypothetical protein
MAAGITEMNADDAFARFSPASSTKVVFRQCTAINYFNMGKKLNCETLNILEEMDSMQMQNMHFIAAFSFLSTKIH